MSPGGLYAHLQKESIDMFRFIAHFLQSFRRTYEYHADERRLQRGLVDCQLTSRRQSHEILVLRRQLGSARRRYKRAEELTINDPHVGEV